MTFSYWFWALDIPRKAMKSGGTISFGLSNQISISIKIQIIYDFKVKTSHGGFIFYQGICLFLGIIIYNIFSMSIKLQIITSKSIPVAIWAYYVQQKVQGPEIEESYNIYLGFAHGVSFTVYDDNYWNIWINQINVVSLVKYICCQPIKLQNID